VQNPKYIQAQKEGKVDYSVLPMNILALDAAAMMEGEAKYGRFNWRQDSIEARTYIAAIGRHLYGDPANGSVGWVNGEDIDPDSGLHHLVKVRACCMLVLDAIQQGTLVDNRLDKESKSIEVKNTPAKTANLAREVNEGLVKADVNNAQQAAIYKHHHGVSTAHSVTFDELIDMEKSPDGLEAYEVHYVVKNQAGDVLAVHKRGPYPSLEDATSYMNRNPERLEGNPVIKPVKVRT
jgi:hypothetical protein